MLEMVFYTNMSPKEWHMVEDELEFIMYVTNRIEYRTFS